MDLICQHCGQLDHRSKHCLVCQKCGGNHKTATCRLCFRCRFLGHEELDCPECIYCFSWHHQSKDCLLCSICGLWGHTKENCPRETKTHECPECRGHLKRDDVPCEGRIRAPHLTDENGYCTTCRRYGHTYSKCLFDWATEMFDVSNVDRIRRQNLRSTFHR